jgi:DNA-nicking Smr family endonuclease
MEDARLAPIVLLEEDAGEKESRPSHSNAARGGPPHNNSRPRGAGAGPSSHTPHDDDEAFVRRQRAGAESLFARRHALMDQSRAAWDGGDHAAAKRLSDEGKAAGAAAAAAQEAAAEAIFAYKNTPARLQPEEVDLHGLHVDEALRFTSRRVQADRARGAKLLIVIYGAGHHSADNKQHLKPAVLAHLAEQEGLAPSQIQVDFDGLDRRANPGCCTVTYTGDTSVVAPVAPPLGPAPDRPAAPPAVVLRAAHPSPAPATVVVVNPATPGGGRPTASGATTSESGWTACCVVM